MIIINPIGDFPLNDDWSYAVPVKSLIEGSGIKFTGWMSMTLFSQVLWGALWCKIFGFSFTVLRFSTLFLGGVGVVYSYKLIRRFTASTENGFLFTLLIAFNPIYVNLSYTFMTDVPFYAFSIISIYHYLKYVEEEKRNDILIGSLSVLIAILTRQLALIMPFSLFFVGLFKLIKSRKIDVRYYLPFILMVIIFFIYQYLAHNYFDARGRYDEMNDILKNHILSSPVNWLKGVFNKGMIGLLYLTLFCSPLIFGLFTKSMDRITWISIIIGGAFSLFLYSKNYVLPILENVIYNFGLGPATLYDSWHLNELKSPNSVNQNFWIVGTIFISILLVFTLIYLSKRYFKKVAFDHKTIFILINFIGYIILVCIINPFDRYFLLPIIFMILLIINQTKIEYYKPAFKVILFGIILFSVLGTKDYLSWNRARWKAIDYLKSENVLKNKIDGGFEFNGWYNYNDEDQPTGLKNLWVHNADYIIAFDNLEGADIVYKQNYFSILWMGEKSIKVLKKNADFKEMEEEYY